MPWAEPVLIPVSEELLIRAEFQREGLRIRDFKISLERIEDDGTTQWLVRFETHGELAHKHERWDNATEARHKHPKSWKGTHAELITLAIRDIKANFERYEELYDAWTRKTERN